MRRFCDCKKISFKIMTIKLLMLILSFNIFIWKTHIMGGGVGTIIFQYLESLAVFIQATERNYRLRKQACGTAKGEREKPT